MPPGMDSLPPPCCSGGEGSDLMPLLIVAGLFFVAHFAFKEWKKRKGKPEMKNLKNLAIIALVVVAVGVVLLIKQNQKTPTEVIPAVVTSETAEGLSDAGQAEAPAALPRLLELGADKCVPCKMMAPILDELRTTYAGQMQVDFTDVWKQPAAGKTYAIRMIPTQIFFGSDGKELFRHEGFFAKEDILAKWQELGMNFSVPAQLNPIPEEPDHGQP